jgi:putative protein-disulfide isomerase
MKLICVVDPMCSWCYGFAASLDTLLAQRPTELNLTLVMGGLRPYTSAPLAASKADEILEHWRHVHEASGQPFAQAPHTALHLPGFVYDTEPASRAIVTVRTRWPQRTWEYFKAVERAFYTDAHDVTQPSVLADVAQHEGLPRAEFDAAFDSDAMREATRADFAQAQAWGIRGFPTLLAQHAGGMHLVCRGYCAAEPLRQRLAAVHAQ